MFFLLNIRLKFFTLPNTLQKFSNIFRLFFSLVFCECRQPGAVLSTARGPVVFTNVVLRVANHGGSRHWETLTLRVVAGAATVTCTSGVLPEGGALVAPFAYDLSLWGQAFVH